jgi:hypothetical protein
MVRSAGEVVPIPVALLFADLGVIKSHSRPSVSDDNPFSESQFKTMKYRPQFLFRPADVQRPIRLHRYAERAAEGWRRLQRESVQGATAISRNTDTGRSSSERELLEVAEHRFASVGACGASQSPQTEGMRTG